LKKIQKVNNTHPRSLLLEYNCACIAIRLGKYLDACTVWFSFLQIPMDKNVDYYQNLLENSMARVKVSTTAEMNDRQNEPSPHQIDTLTNVCIRFWISRTREQFAVTSKMLNTFLDQ